VKVSPDLLKKEVTFIYSNITTSIEIRINVIGELTRAERFDADQM